MKKLVQPGEKDSFGITSELPYLQDHKEDTASLITVMHGRRIRDSSQKLSQWRFS